MMEAKTIANAKPKTDEEYIQEIDRMIPEIEAMLANAQRISNESRRIGEENRRMINALEQQLLCGKK